jgi:hypothetical protein
VDSIVSSGLEVLEDSGFSLYPVVKLVGGLR